MAYRPCQRLLLHGWHRDHGGFLVQWQSGHDRHLLQWHASSGSCHHREVEGLEAIIPIAPNTSYYHYYRSNGLIRHPGGYIGEDIDCLYDFIHSGNPDRASYCDETIRDTEMAQGMDRTHGDYNDFWAGRDYLNHLGPMKAATLMAHAFNDWNVMPEHSVRIYQALRRKRSSRAGLLPPGRPRWRAPAETDEPMVHTLSPRHSKWRGE